MTPVLFPLPDNVTDMRMHFLMATVENSIARVRKLIEEKRARIDATLAAMERDEVELPCDVEREG